MNGGKLGIIWMLLLRSRTNFRDVEFSMWLGGTDKDYDFVKRLEHVL